VFWLSADKAIDEFAIFEDEHGRYAGNLKARSGARIFVNIKFAYSVTAL
jgi:hypothetical protein